MRIPFPFFSIISVSNNGSCVSAATRRGEKAEGEFMICVVAVADVLVLLSSSHEFEPSMTQLPTSLPFEPIQYPTKSTSGGTVRHYGQLDGVCAADSNGVCAAIVQRLQ